MGFSAFLKALPVGPKQYEGFNYLGLGAILLLSIAAIRFIITCRKVKFDREKIYFFMPLIVVLTGFLLLAVSNKISYGSSSITLFSIPQFLEMPFGVFRASGRFGWPIYYVILYAGLYMLASQMTRKYTISILSICLIVQLADLKPLLSQNLTPAPKQLQSHLKDPFWENTSSEVNKVIVYPPFLKNIIDDNDYKYLALYAARHGMAINTGYVARTQDKLMSEYRRDLEDEISRGQTDPKNLYILRGLPQICELMRSGYNCYNIDGYNLCVSKSISSGSSKPLGCAEVTLDNFLAKFDQRIVILAIDQLAYSSFSEKLKDYFKERGSKIDQLRPGDHYVGALIGDRVCGEVVEKGEKWSVTFHQGDLCGKMLRTDVRISSKTRSVTARTTIECGGIECAKNDLGINAIVVNDSGAVLLTSSSGGQFSDHVFLVDSPEVLETFRRFF